MARMTQKGAPRKIFWRLFRGRKGKLIKTVLEEKLRPIIRIENDLSVSFKEEFEDITCEVKIT